MATAWLDSGTMWFVFIFIFAPAGCATRLPQDRSRSTPPCARAAQIRRIVAFCAARRDSSLDSF
jgi:hypothetical protein